MKKILFFLILVLALYSLNAQIDPTVPLGWQGSQGNKTQRGVSQKKENTLSANTNVSTVTINNSYQGWYVPSSHDAGNPNYIVGYVGNNYRNYFTFNLNSLDLTGKQITGAKLLVLEGGCSSGNSTVTYTLYDVTSNTNLLVVTQTGAAAQGIWNDLGSGVSYGAFSQSTLFSGTRTYNLNQNAIDAITANAGGWFSIGGALTSVTNDHYLFGCSGNFYQQLVLELADDAEPPTVTCPANVVVNNDANQCGAIVNYSPAIFTGEPTPTVSYSHPSGSFFPVGTTTVTVTASNSAGSASCSFTVTVNDEQAPNVTQPNDITVPNTADQCSASVNFSASASDNCSITSLKYYLYYNTANQEEITFPKTFAVGNYVVTVVAKDAANNTTTKTFTITVTDNQAPSITCPGPVTINMSQGLCTGTATLVPPVVTDNCNSFGNALSFDGGYVNVPNAAILNPFNEWTLETWVKRTSNGVQESLIEKYVEPASNYGYLLRILSTNKAQAGFVFGSFGGYFISGTTNILPNTWYHLAATFNRTTGVMKLYVNGVLDAQVTGMTGLPTIPNTASLKLGARGDDAGTRLSNGGLMDEVRIWSVERTQAQIQLSMNSELGAQAGLIALYHLNQGIAGGNNTGFTTVTDESGNGQNGSLVSFALTGPTSNWVNGKSFGLTLTNDAPSTYPKGNTNVTWTATDGGGNTVTCTQVVTVVDNQPPAFTCPANQNVNLSNTCQLVVPELVSGLTGSDNCGVVTFTQSPVAGSSLASSHNQTHNVVITANDGNGNIQTCTVVLTGKDITPPVINCVENITRNNDPGVCGAIVNYTSPFASDNCGCVAPTSISGYTLLGTYNGHKYFLSNQATTWTNAKAMASALGGHLATITSAGEESFLEGTVGVQAWIGFTDEVNEGSFVWVTGEPVSYTNWLLPSEPNNSGGNENYAQFRGHGTKWNDVVNSWNGQFIVEFECETNTGGVIVTQTGGLLSGSTFPVGVTTNAFLAIDAAGNTSTCSFTVTITDNEQPAVTKGSISSCYSSVASAEAAALEATSYSDNCSSSEELDVTVSTAGTCSAVITVTVTDASNNSKSVTYNTKIDNTAPVLSLTPSNTTVNCQSIPPVPTVTASDNCDGSVNVTYNTSNTQGSDPTQSNYYNYTITRKWSASDGCGNTVQHTQTITVQDVTAPQINCPADKTDIPFDFEQLYATISIGNATATDNCAASADIIIAGTRSDNVDITNQQYPLGSTTVSWSATDPSTSSSGCTQTVTVRKRNTSVTYTGDMTNNKIVVQYSDIIYLQAKLTDNEGLVTPNNISGRTITFQLLSGTTVLRSKTATTNASGVALDTFKIEQAPGLYKVKTIFAGDNYFNNSYDLDDCEVKQEDAIVEYNGSQYFTTASSTTMTGSITLAASINDIDDGSDKRGDIRKAKATFRDGGPASTILGSANLPVGLVNPGILTNGLSATTQNNITLNSNEAGSGGKIFQVWVGASDHYTGADAGPTPVTLALPGQDFVTGGGNLVVTTSAGTYAGTVNSKMNFGFTMKWNKSGKNLQGNINIVFRKWQLYNGVWQWRVYQAKSNAINSMAVVEVGANGQPVSGTNPAAFRKAIINTKANLKDVTDPLNNIDLGGNHNLTLDAWDHITANGGISDKISVTLMGATTNELLFSSSWSSNATQAQTITGGNINVRNGSGSSSAGKSNTTKTAEMESKPAEEKTMFSVKAYPNPSEHQFTIVVNSNLNEAVQIQLYDALGRLIETINPRANEATRFGEKLKTGIYVAKVIQGTKIETIKLIKQ